MEQVTLPTGGQIKFTYGSHQYGTEKRFKKYNNWDDAQLLSLSNENTSIGGVRIEKIETYSDANSLVETKTFTYKNVSTDKSTGIYYNIYEIYDGGINPYFDGKEKEQIAHPYNYSLITSHIGYSNVTQETVSSTEKSKVTYTFSTGQSVYTTYSQRDSHIQRKYVEGSNLGKELSSGSLTYEGHLIAPGQVTNIEYFEGDRKVRSTQFKYNSGATQNTLGCTDTIVCLSTYSAHVARKLFVCPDVLEKVTTQELADGLTMKSEQNIVYDKKLRKKVVKTTDSRGRVLFTKYTYPDEVAQIEYTPVYQKLTNTNRINRPIETITGYIEDGKEYITGGIVEVYSDDKPNYQYSRPYLSSIRTMSLSEPLPITSYQWFKDGNAENVCDPRYTKKSTYKFDDNDRLVSETPYCKLETKYTWKGLYPATKTIGKQTWTYEYIPYVGIKSVTDPYGIITKYEYDNAGRLIKESQVVDGKERILNIYQYHIQTEQEQ